MRAKVISRINKRLWPSTRNTPLPHPLNPNDVIEVLEEVEGEAVTPTNNKWYKTDRGFYVWSGGVDAKATTDLRLLSEVQGLSNTANYWIKFFQIAQLWKKSKGEGIRVAILDSGIDFNHADLQEAIDKKENFIRPGEDVMDFDGHGTHCAGIIAGRGKVKIFGVAPEAKLNVGKIFSMRGFGINEEVLKDAIKWAVGNSDIISISAGIPESNPEIAKLIEEATGKGKIFVSAIGNIENQQSNTGDFPATNPHTISVGSCNDRFEISTFTKRYKGLSICSPGEQILSTFPSSITPYDSLTGTSMATPFIAGLICIMRGMNRQLNLTDAKLKLSNLVETKTDNSFVYPVLKSMPIKL